LYKFSVLATQKFVAKSQEASQEFYQLLKAVLFLYLVVIISFLALGFVFDYITHNSSEEATVRNNYLLMEADRKLFGAYVPFWFQSAQNTWRDFFDSLSALFIAVYLKLDIIFGAAFILLLAVDSRIFYQTLLAFILCMALSLPFWFFFPALSPLEGYLDNILDISIPPDIEREIENYRPNSGLQNFFTAIRRLDSERSSFLAITTIPSMHVAWTTILLYFGIKLSAFLGIILVPYSVFNFIASIYTMQHYAVDAFAGVFIALVAIILVEVWAKNAPEAIRFLTEMFQSDGIKLSGFVRRKMVEYQSAAKKE
jgi:hypothetical protein